MNVFQSKIKEWSMANEISLSLTPMWYIHGKCNRNGKFSIYLENFGLKKEQ